MIDAKIIQFGRVDGQALGDWPVDEMGQRSPKVFPRAVSWQLQIEILDLPCDAHHKCRCRPALPRGHEMSRGNSIYQPLECEYQRDDRVKRGSKLTSNFSALALKLVQEDSILCYSSIEVIELGPELGWRHVWLEMACWRWSSHRARPAPVRAPNPAKIHIRALPALVMNSDDIHHRVLRERGRFQEDRRPPGRPYAPRFRRYKLSQKLDPKLEVLTLHSASTNINTPEATNGSNRVSWIFNANATCRFRNLPYGSMTSTRTAFTSSHSQAAASDSELHQAAKSETTDIFYFAAKFGRYSQLQQVQMYRHNELVLYSYSPEIPPINFQLPYVFGCRPCNKQMPFRLPDSCG
ncbi:hypothetical protein B0H13DRAFT_1889116 [Mycena leptocephala]|nr:hypothetical protein B0H13DRAFT_1889116 [Mycena leptocephala]